MSSAATLLVSGVFFLAFPLFFRGWMGKRFPEHWMSPAYFVFLPPLAMGVWHWAWTAASFSAREAFTPFLTYSIGTLLGFLLLPAAIVVFWGAGRTLASDADLARWFSLEAAFQRRWTRPTGAALVQGVLCGFALACVPFAGLFAPGPPRAVSMMAPPKIVLSPSAWAAPLEMMLTPVTFAVFLLVLPLRHHLRLRALGWTVFLAVSTLAFGVMRDLFDFWLFRNLTAGFALTLASLAIYFAFDLLAVVAAHITAVSAVVALAMSIQPAGLRLDALSAMLFPMLLLAIGLAALATGSAVDVAAEVARQRAETKEAASDRDRLRGEFDVARKAQLGMLPPLPETIGASSLAASCYAAREVGGDLYDFFECPDGRYGLCVADVSGKGVPAALYMSLTKGILAAAGLEGAPIPQVMATLNRHLLEFGRRKMFVTMSLGYYDARSRVLEHARAGHNPPILWRAQVGTAEFLKPRGVGLGLAGASSFGRTLEVQSVELAPGDIIVFYSDGIVEAMNLNNDQFGEERLTDAVRDCAGLSAAGVEQEISRRVRSFAGAAPVHDDQTLLVLRVG
jgi:serine phosphatase RsbU (regulator of sigma subunit)